MFVWLWGLHKNASLPWSLRIAEEIMRKHGFAIGDPAAGPNIHVMGHKSNPEVLVTVLCMRLGQSPTAVTIHAVSTDANAARVAGEQVRDGIKRTHSLEGDVIQNPVNE